MTFAYDRRNPLHSASTRTVIMGVYINKLPGKPPLSISPVYIPVISH